MIRYLLLVLCVLAGYGADEYGQGGTGLTPNLGASSPYGMGGDIAGAVLNQAGFYDINAQAQTMVRATGAYDPIANVITAPGVLRTRNVYVGSHTYSAAFIEGPRTNLLAAGTTEFQSQQLGSTGSPAWLYSVTNITVTNGQTGANGEASAVQIVATGASFLRQVITVTPSTQYVMSFLAKNNGGTAATYLVYDVTHTADIVAQTSFISQLNGSSFVKVSVPFTTPAGCVSINVYPSRETGAGANFIVDKPMLEQAAFPSSYISNRNLHTFSEKFASWTVQRATATNATTANPFNSNLTACTVVEDTSVTLNHNVNQVISKAASSLTYTTTVYAKRGVGSRGLLIQPSGGGVNGSRIYFDLSNGNVVSASTFGAGFTNISQSATLVGGFYKCVCSYSTDASADNTVYLMMTTSTFGVGSQTYTGDGASSIILYGAQTEYGTTPTTYWGVNGTVGGRDADNLSVSLAGITDTRQNWFLYSEQLDNAAWNKQGGTVTANSTNDSQGNPYADTFVESAANVNHFFSPTALLATTDGATYTEIIEAKNAGRNILIGEVKDRSGATIGTPSVNLTTGVVTGTVTGGTVAATALANGWWRIAVTWPAGVGSSVTKIAWFLNLYGPYLGDGTSGIYFARHQFVQGTDPGASGYLPTAATAVTATQTGLSTTNGTVLALGIPYGRGTAGTGCDIAHSGNTPFAMDVGSPNGFYRDRNATQSAPTETAGVLATYALTWDASFVRDYVGGVQSGSIATTATSAPFNTVGTFNIGNIGALSAPYNGWVWLGVFNTTQTAQQNATLATFAHL